MEKIDPNSFKGQPIFVGIDVHKSTWQVTIQVKDLIYQSVSIQSEWSVLEKLLEPFKESKVPSCYEAGYFGYTLHDPLIAWGACNIVVSPAQIPTMSNSKVKTDKIDSKKLANFLSKGMLKGIEVPVLEKRDHRELIRYRQ